MIGMHPADRVGRRSGLTLIELLVVVAIIGVVCLFVLSAVMSAREAARRATCTDHLRQFGVALLNFESASGTLPSCGRYQLSVHAVLLPYLEQAPLANALNYNTWWADNPPALTQETSLEIFRCPSDAGAWSGSGSNNYAINVDAWNQNAPFRGRSTPLRDVTDGTSQTVAASEWIVGHGSGAGVGSYELPEQLLDYDSLAVTCDNLNVSGATVGLSKGSLWSLGQVPDTIYNHILSINKNSCVNGNNLTFGVWTAGSRHPGGANALFLDGHVHFQTNSTAVPVWRALGTKNGGEIVGDP